MERKRLLPYLAILFLLGVRWWVDWSNTYSYFEVGTLVEPDTFDASAEQKGLSYGMSNSTDSGENSNFTVGPSMEAFLSQHPAVLLDTQMDPPENEPAWKSAIPAWLGAADESLPPNTPGAYIHIGKAGGSTISWLLRHGCHGFVAKPCNRNIMNSTNGMRESRVSPLVTYYHIPDFGWSIYQEKQPQYRFYVWSLRDPLARTISAFLFMHPDNVRVREPSQWRRANRQYGHFFRCFPSLQSFADQVGETYNGTLASRDEEQDSAGCADKAWAAFQNLPGSKTLNQTDVVPTKTPHFDWDIRRLWDALEMKHRSASGDVTGSAASIDSPIHLVLRQEYLWDDWITANTWLGEQPEAVATFPEMALRDHSAISNQFPIEKELSPRGQESLCGALVEEYRAYLTLLTRAANLSTREKEASWQLAIQSCPNLLHDLALET